MLQHNKQHGHYNNRQSSSEMLPLLDVIAVDTHQLSQRQGGGEFRKLSRLQAQWSQYQPRSRAFDGMGIEDGAEEQDKQQAEDDKRQHLVIAVVEHQQDKAQYDRSAYPHNLHTRARIKAEDIRIAVTIAGTADTHPPECEQGEVEYNRPPVKRADDAFRFFICRIHHKLYVVLEFSWPLPQKLPRVCRE